MNFWSLVEEAGMDNSPNNFIMRFYGQQVPRWPCEQHLWLWRTWWSGTKLHPRLCQPPGASDWDGAADSPGERSVWLSWRGEPERVKMDIVVKMERNWCSLSCINSYFSDNQYPDEAKREEIATACNSVIQKPGMLKRLQLDKYINHHPHQFYLL